MGGMRRLRQVFLAEPDILPATVETLVHYATQARKGGIVSLEDDVALIADPFLRKALTLAVDGTDMDELRAMMELQIALEEHRAEAEAKVFESAGGYSPTIGIIGAVMGLIQVMKHLENIEEVGHGIAVAFVATVYGVAAANLLFLPAANKMKARGQEELQRKELMLEGVISIVEGLNPKLVRSKLSAYVQGPAGKGAGAASQPGKQGGEHAATVEAEA
jgi:chemotaxis protein MotA